MMRLFRYIRHRRRTSYTQKPPYSIYNIQPGLSTVYIYFHFYFDVCVRFFLSLSVRSLLFSQRKHGYTNQHTRQMYYCIFRLRNFEPFQWIEIIWNNYTASDTENAINALTQSTEMNWHLLMAFGCLVIILLYCWVREREKQKWIDRNAQTFLKHIWIFIRLSSSSSSSNSFANIIFVHFVQGDFWTYLKRTQCACMKCVCFFFFGQSQI